MVAKPPRAVSLTSEMKCGPSTRWSRSLRATAAKSSARIAAEASIRDVVSHTPALLSALRCSRVPKFLPRTLMASMPAKAARPTATPSQGAAGRQGARTA